MSSFLIFYVQSSVPVPSTYRKFQMRSDKGFVKQVDQFGSEERERVLDSLNYRRRLCCCSPRLFAGFEITRDEDTEIALFSCSGQ